MAISCRFEKASNGTIISVLRGPKKIETFVLMDGVDKTINDILSGIPALFEDGVGRKPRRKKATNGRKKIKKTAATKRGRRKVAEGAQA